MKNQQQRNSQINNYFKFITIVVLIMTVLIAVVGIGTTYASFYSSSKIENNSISVGSIGISTVLSMSSENELLAGGGSATVSDGELVVTNIAPMDTIIFTLTLTNNGTLHTYYDIGLLFENAEMLSGFDITIADKDMQTVVTGITEAKIVSEKLTWLNTEESTREYTVTMVSNDNVIGAVFDIEVNSWQFSENSNNT